MDSHGCENVAEGVVCRVNVRLQITPEISLLPLLRKRISSVTLCSICWLNDRSPSNKARPSVNVCFPLGGTTKELSASGLFRSVIGYLRETKALRKYFFRLCSSDESARSPFYPVIPLYNTWNTGYHRLAKKKQLSHKVISRIHNVGLTEFDFAGKVTCCEL